MRFSDEKLMDFYEEFKIHVENCRKMHNLEREKFEKLLESQKSLASDSCDVIRLHKDLQSAARIGIKIQKFGLWLVKWPVIGLGLYSIYKWIVANLPG